MGKLYNEIGVRLNSVDSYDELTEELIDIVKLLATTIEGLTSRVDNLTQYLDENIESGTIGGKDE